MIDYESLTEDQRQGFACVVCSRTDRSMVPVGTIQGCQIFACTDCERKIP